MPLWSQWITFILATLVAVLVLGRACLACRTRRRPLRLGLSIHPHAVAGYDSNLKRTFPNEMLQLDITNTGKHPVQLAAVQMRMADGSEAPAFDEELGEQWALEKPLAPGAHSRVACSDLNECTLDLMQALVVRTTDGKETTLGRKAIERVQADLAHRRTTGSEYE